MRDQVSDVSFTDRSGNLETRVAIDVMFEALSHIQASIDASSEEERVESYRKFKEALYERYEYLLDERREEHAPAEALEKPVNGNGHAPDQPTETDADSEEDSDTLGKLWPAISEKQDAPDD